MVKICEECKIELKDYELPVHGIELKKLDGTITERTLYYHKRCAEFEPDFV